MRRLHRYASAPALFAGLMASSQPAPAASDSHFTLYRAPAGEQPTATSIPIDVYDGAILPNGRYVTPAGLEASVGAPKPFGLALSPDGRAVATVNSGTFPFSITLFRDLNGAGSSPTVIDVNAAFMGIRFSPDGTRFYASGGENGNLWIGDVATQAIIGSVNLNGAGHPLGTPLDPQQGPANHFRGAYPGDLVLSRDGNFLYVVDQAGFQVHVVDTRQIVTGTDASGAILEPDNFAAVVGALEVGRYPFGVALSPDDRTLYVANVGVFEYSHLRPETPTGDPNVDYPLCIPGAGYPEETSDDRTLKIKRIDASAISSLPATMTDPEGIRCGYVYADQTYTVPGLGDPNADPSSSVFVVDVSSPAAPAVAQVIKTGVLIGEEEDGIAAYGGAHPNAIVAGSTAVYVANGNNDSIAVLDPVTYEVIDEVSLSFLTGSDAHLKGVQPVALALSPDEQTLYVAEAGLNAVGVVSLAGGIGTVEGHIPVGWWPSALEVSADGLTLYVASAKGRGAGPHLVRKPVQGSPSGGVFGIVNAIDVPSTATLVEYTERVLENNGFVETPPASDPTNPIPSEPGVPSAQIKHVIFISKENAPFDLLLGDITETRQGVAVEGMPRYSLGRKASPNHHELALSFAFSDNFYLEPSVSSDGHRWLNGSYTTEFEETHWPASYGGERDDAGDDPEVYENYPGRLGFSGSNGSPDPQDYNQHGGIAMHLARHGLGFANFGNGYELAMVQEDSGTEPTGIRNRVNIPMEKVVRDNSDHLYAEFNVTIPDSPLPEDPDRYNRYGRFEQIFSSRYVEGDTCKLPEYVDLYYPNDHGGGAFDINGEGGKPWDFRRYVQDNDSALGRTVDLISHSPCWKDTVIFVTEDDTQNGVDHVDGFRTILLVISPWARREYVSKTHTSLPSIFKTIDLILGIPPLNLYDAGATDLRDMFTGTADMTPYTYQPVPFATNAADIWARLTRDIDFKAPDADEIDLRAAILESERLPRPMGERGRRR